MFGQKGQNAQDVGDLDGDGDVDEDDVKIQYQRVCVFSHSFRAYMLLPLPPRFGSTQDPEPAGILAPLSLFEPRMRLLLSPSLHSASSFPLALVLQKIQIQQAVPALPTSLESRTLFLSLLLRSVVPGISNTELSPAPLDSRMLLPPFPTPYSPKLSPPEIPSAMLLQCLSEFYLVQRR